MTKTLYAYRYKLNPSFMIVCSTPDGAKFVTKGWCYYATGLDDPFDGEKLEKELEKWELITLTVEEDD